MQTNKQDKIFAGVEFPFMAFLLSLRWGSTCRQAGGCLCLHSESAYQTKIAFTTTFIKEKSPVMPAATVDKKNGHATLNPCFGSTFLEEGSVDSGSGGVKGQDRNEGKT